MESAALPLALLSEVAPELRRRLETGEWTSIGVGESDAQVFRLSGERPRPRTGREVFLAELEDERRAPGPEQALHFRKR